jgi:hypothetical protein
MMVLSR